MRTENGFQLACKLDEVKTEDGHWVLTGRVQLHLSVPRQDGRLPSRVEQTVEEAGQELKRWMYRQFMEKLDTELVLSLRGGKNQEGFVCHGRRTMTFKTVFGSGSGPILVASSGRTFCRGTMSGQGN